MNIKNRYFKHFALNTQKETCSLYFVLPKSIMYNFQTDSDLHF